MNQSDYIKRLNWLMIRFKLYFLCVQVKKRPGNEIFGGTMTGFLTPVFIILKF